MKQKSHNKKAKIALLLAMVLALMASVSAFVACTGGDNQESPATTDGSTATEATTAEDALAKEKEEKYLEAFNKLAQDDYEAAYALFVELGDYKDAAKQVAKFHYVFDGYTETFGMPEEMDTETVVVTYNENNLPIKCEKTYLDGFVHTCTFEYDENGRLITIECHHNGEFYVKSVWTYDENGNNLTYVFDCYDGTSYVEVRTYDEKGNNLTIVAEGKGGHYDTAYEGGYHASYEIFYDENGNNTKFHAIDGSETLDGESWYTEDGVLTKSVVTVTCGEDVTIEEETYDEKGNLIRKTYTKDGAVYESYDYTYDDKGNMLKELYKYNDEEGEYVCTEDYTNDANGNCVKKVVEDSDGYTSELNVTQRLVYVPYEYAEEYWEWMLEGMGLLL